MSRRPPNPAAERAAQNQATIKNLLKLEPNKICADCKRNKHPRWASWNLGVFVCIRCSGIHRGMGTHISRVKSVDLDSWTDEQLQSILSWGNARANKYWEAKLATGHVPSEAKIENFIRTKYELKRWVMDGPMPDPATLDAEGDDEVPLSLVKEKQAIERKESLRKQRPGVQATPGVKQPLPPPDLMGGDPIPRASTAGPPVPSKVPPKAEAAPPKTTAAKDSLLGLDFFGEQPVAPPRPSSTSTPGTAAGGQSRPDLKQSILSLYASAPRPQSQAPPQQPTSNTTAFGGMSSPTFAQQPSQPGVGGLNDAFGGLSFATTSPKPQAPPDPFEGLGAAKSRPNPQQTSSSSFGALSGGSFFDPKPAQPAASVSHQRGPSNSGFGGLGSFTSPTSTPAKPAAPAASSSSALGDLFDFTATPSQPAAPAMQSAQPTPSATTNSVFNLSAPQPKPQAAVAPAPPLPVGGSSMSSTSWSNSDVWGSNAWSTPEATATTTAQPAATTPQLNRGGSDFGGWGSSSGFGSGSTSLATQSIVPGQSGGFAPKVAADEEFGGWTSSTGPATAGKGAAKPASGFGGNDDLWNNVWQ